MCSLHLSKYVNILFLLLRYQPSFHGVDLSALRGAAVDEYFRQPIVVRYPSHTHRDVYTCLKNVYNKCSRNSECGVVFSLTGMSAFLDSVPCLRHWICCCAVALYDWTLTFLHRTPLTFVS